MADDYLTPAGYGEAEYIDKKSRFIGQVSPVKSEGEAMAFIESVRKKYPDASHNVWAYSLHGGAMRFSDDGEPGGTSGMPTLNVFRSGGILDVCCVVTRYFGGTLLGSGGLVRAYSKAASAAMENAGLARMSQWSVITVRCGYGQYERVKRLLDDFEAADAETGFGADVSISALVPSGAAEVFTERLTDVTAGGAECRVCGEVFRPKRL